jgi:hypothetical protein
VWSLYEICQGQRRGVYHVTSLQNFLICPIIKQDTLIISPPAKAWWLLHIPPQTTLILYFVFEEYFRVPCNYHNKQLLFPYTKFAGHFSNIRTVVFSSRSEQPVCSTQATGCAVTCQAGGCTPIAPYTIPSLEGGRWSSPRPGRLSPAKKTQHPSGKSGWMRKTPPPPPPSVRTLHRRARAESLHDCAIVAAGPLYITQVKWKHIRGQRSSG